MNAPARPTDDRGSTGPSPGEAVVKELPAPLQGDDGQASTDEAVQQAAQRSGRMRLRIVALSAALCGMVLGAVVEMFVQGAMESTGWFGPTIETVIEEQLANFTAIQDKLAALEAATTDADRARLTAELADLLAEQERLAQRTHMELSTTQQQLDAVRSQALREGGVAGGVDFWLTPGESVSVGSRNNVFALYRIYSSYISVTMSGENHRMTPGDFLDAPVGDATYKVFYRTAPTTANQNRAGFDIVRPDE